MHGELVPRLAAMTGEAAGGPRCCARWSATGLAVAARRPAVGRAWPRW
jgi:hypothetical protein